MSLGRPQWTRSNVQQGLLTETRELYKNIRNICPSFRHSARPSFLTWHEFQSPRKRQMVSGAWNAREIRNGRLLARNVSEQLHSLSQHPRYDPGNDSAVSSRYHFFAIPPRVRVCTPFVPYLSKSLPPISGIYVHVGTCISEKIGISRDNARFISSLATTAFFAEFRDISVARDDTARHDWTADLRK